MGKAAARTSAIFCTMTTESLKGIVHSDPDIMGGTPVFVGTRVPLQNLIDYLEGGESIEDFLDGFPSVKREQVLGVIEAGKTKVLETVKSCALDRRVNVAPAISRKVQSPHEQELRLSFRPGDSGGHRGLQGYARPTPEPDRLPRRRLHAR